MESDYKILGLLMSLGSLQLFSVIKILEFLRWQASLWVTIGMFIFACVAGIAGLWLLESRKLVGAMLIYSGLQIFLIDLVTNSISFDYNWFLFSVVGAVVAVIGIVVLVQSRK